jgi:hypothetical protein
MNKIFGFSALLALIFTVAIQNSKPVCIYVTEREPIKEVLVSEVPAEPKVVARHVKIFPDPSMIPRTKSWVWRGGDGARNLREHIMITHKIPDWKLTNFKTTRQLEVLHSYLHNGGKI